MRHHLRFRASIKRADKSCSTRPGFGSRYDRDRSSDQRGPPLFARCRQPRAIGRAVTTLSAPARFSPPHFSLSRHPARCVPQHLRRRVKTWPPAPLANFDCWRISAAHRRPHLIRLSPGSCGHQRPSPVSAPAQQPSIRKSPTRTGARPTPRAALHIACSCSCSCTKQLRSTALPPAPRSCLPCRSNTSTTLSRSSHSTGRSASSSRQ